LLAVAGYQYTISLVRLRQTWTSLVNLRKKTINFLARYLLAWIVVSRCYIRTYAFGGGAPRPKSLRHKGLRRFIGCVCKYTISKVL